MSLAALIGVDWGTTNLRVMQIAEDGTLLESRADPRGAGRLQTSEFESIIQEVAGDWLASDTPVLVCGMAGAPGRWIDAGYIPCPAGPAEIIAGLKRPQASSLAIIPAVAMTDAAGLQDVMRGEETQILGLTPLSQEAEVIVAPGTHSKWVVMEGERIRRFRTFMTGELFAALRRATVLGVGMDDPGVDDAAFHKGVERGLADAALTAALFSARVEMLAGRIPHTGTADYLSGLLIGAEIAAQPTGSLTQGVTLVGETKLCGRYMEALAVAGCTDVRVRDALQAVARGFWRIWKASQ